MNFNDIFQSSFLESVQSFSLLDVCLAMLFAAALGLFIFLIYKKSFSSAVYSPGFALSLVGLSLVTALVIMAVTSNVVLSLGMVGALSIVRFRAAIKEPLEIVFLFWALAVGIVVGAGLIPLACVGSLCIGLILLLFANRKSHLSPYILVLSCADEAAEEAAHRALAQAVARYVVKSKTVRDTGIELTAELRLKDAGTAFVNRLQAIEGVQSAVLVSYNGDYLS